MSPQLGQEVLLGLRARTAILVSSQSQCQTASSERDSLGSSGQVSEPGGSGSELHETKTCGGNLTRCTFARLVVALVLRFSGILIVRGGQRCLRCGWV